ncbi:hypothetical protein [Saccharopolyspora hattusasensis]|uniref:hypothetical protein n=1 Tax=Saccharopolyspora hattusasensis TaxID=1128679 RepID=UPI003D95239B
MHVRAPTLGQAQRLMVATTIGDVTRSGWVEHTEHAVGDGLWVREALDERVLEREHTAQVLMEVLTDQRLRARLATLPACRVGGVPVVVCVPGDTLDWVLDQHDRHGALIVAAAVTNHHVWWNALAPADCAAETDLCGLGSLADIGLTDLETTVDDWMVATDCGGLVLLAPRHTTAATHPHRGEADPYAGRRAGAQKLRARLLTEFETSADPLRATELRTRAHELEDAQRLASRCRAPNSVPPGTGTTTPSRIDQKRPRASR